MGYTGASRSREAACACSLTRGGVHLTSSHASAACPGLAECTHGGHPKCRPGNQAPDLGSAEEPGATAFHRRRLHNSGR
jgi:hypothetical protein